LGKLCEAEGSEDGNDVCVVGEVEVQRLIGGECGWIAVQCYVDVRITVPQSLVLEASDRFLLDVSLCVVL
jgi:hypothetical protein